MRRWFMSMSANVKGLGSVRRIANKGKKRKGREGRGGRYVKVRVG